ncbi:MAG: O-antigen ligase family protein [Gallionella sp.]|nr:O-antigen ligase family protein [Gallionella sp.]
MGSLNKLLINDVQFARVLLALLGFSVPISTVLDNVLLVAVLIFGLIICWRDALKISYQNPVAQAALLLFGMLLIATCYGETPFDKAFGILGKYLDIAMIPLFIAMIRKEQNRDSVLNGFLLAMLVTLILSYLVFYQVLSPKPWMWWQASVGSPAIFRHQLTQNTFMALAVFFALLRMRKATVPFHRTFWCTLAVLGMFNVFFMVEGRTGYATLLILLGWFAWTTLSGYLAARGKHISLRHGIAVALIMALTIVSVYFSSARLQTRMDLIVAELGAWKPHAGNETSVGIRMEFYYNTLHIIRQNPLLGVGTGGLPAAYAEQDKHFSLGRVDNPHNEYLMISVQTGIIGLALLLYLFYAQWRFAPLLDSAFQRDAARGLVLATMTDSLFNSPLLDHAPGLLFALMSATFFANLKASRNHG